MFNDKPTQWPLWTICSSRTMSLISIIIPFHHRIYQQPVSLQSLNIHSTTMKIFFVVGPGTVPASFLMMLLLFCKKFNRHHHHRISGDGGMDSLENYLLVLLMDEHEHGQHFVRWYKSKTVRRMVAWVSSKQITSSSNTNCMHLKCADYQPLSWSVWQNDIWRGFFLAAMSQ